MARPSDRFVRAEQPVVEGELSHEQVQRRELLSIDELLQASAGAPQGEHVLVAQMIADQIQNQLWQFL